MIYTLNASYDPGDPESLISMFHVRSHLSHLQVIFDWFAKINPTVPISQGPTCSPDILWLQGDHRKLLNTIYLLLALKSDL